MTKPFSSNKMLPANKHNTLAVPLPPQVQPIPMKPSNLLDTLKQQPITTQKLTLNCPILDQFLAGGIPCKSITELVAESGTGKTQLCLQLLLNAQLPISLGGLSSSSLYLHSEFPFPNRRLRQLSHSFLKSNIAHFNPTSYDPLDKVLVHAVHDAHHLFDVLLKLDSFLVRRNFNTHWPVKLIVIDSIAALFRSEFDNTPADMKKRSSFFFKISGRLRALAEKFGLAVVITNQVVDFVGSNDGLRIGNLDCLFTSGRRVCPALGLAWANCVNTRLFMSRSEEVVVGETSGLVEEDGSSSVCIRTRRHIHVVFAPHLPPSSCEFTILREGIFGVESSNDWFTSNSRGY